MHGARGLLEGERGGGNAGGLTFAVAHLDRIAAAIDDAAHGAGFLAGVRNRNFRVDAEARVAALARDGAGKAQHPPGTRLAVNQDQPRYPAVENRLVTGVECLCLFVCECRIQPIARWRIAPEYCGLLWQDCIGKCLILFEFF